jgi:hypothetical protein
MSENDKTPEPGAEHASGPSSIGDEQLPADLVASEDNPLAEGLETGEDVHVREEGKRAEQMPDPEDEDEDQGSEQGDDTSGA